MRSGRRRTRLGRRALVLVLAGLLAAGASRALDESTQGSATSRPNILLILLDDLGISDLGPYGPSGIKTESLQRFAGQSVRFTDFYTTPLCSPTRAAILSGLYPQRFGIRRVLPPSSSLGLPERVSLLPEMLKAAGYDTAHFGKWHLGRTRPLESGFDRSAVLLPSGTYFGPTLRLDDREEVQRGGHQTRVITDYALHYLREARESRRPFFLNLWYNAPHAPAVPPRDWADRYPDTELGRYNALVGAVDEEIGRVLDALESLGMWEKTIVVIASDNGGARLGSETLRGFKGSVFEGGIRAPLMMRWPGHWEPGSVSDSVVACQDLLPTLAEALGLEAPLVDGESFLPSLRKERWSRSGPLVWETPYPKSRFEPTRGFLNAFAIRSGDLKLVFDQDTPSRHFKRAQSDSPWSLKLFDIAQDPLESVDLFSQRAEDVQALLDGYWIWRERVGRLPLVFEDARRGEGLVFGEPGRAPFDSQEGYDVRDERNLSFTARIRRLESPGGPAVIVSQPGSWELISRKDGHLSLVVLGKDGERRRVASEQALEPGVWCDVAFGIYSFRYSEKLLRLYLDGEVYERVVELEPLDELEGGPGFGARADGGAPFLGEIRDARFYGMFLLPAEVGRIRRERDALGKGSR